MKVLARPRELDEPVAEVRGQVAEARPSGISLLSQRTLLGLALLLAWEGSGRFLVDPFWTSSPTRILGKLAEWTANGSLFFHLFITVREMLLGFVVGAVAGVCAGFLLGRNERLALLVEPYLMALFALPKVALAPLLILWLGIGIESKIALVAIIVFFLLFYNTLAGVRDVNPNLVNIVRLMGASERQIIAKIVIPSAGAWILTGVRISIPYSLIGAVIGEIIASNKGLGYLTEFYAGMFDTDGVYAALVLLMLLAVVLNVICGRVEQRALRWR
ncbi:MAG: ABC transporter permease [Deltaproteobacteria bacterium]|nr:ABC transporter permease [Deltaproteobacteria bacterium]